MVMSIVNYSAFSFVNLPLYLHNKLHKLIMSVARWSNISYDFKVKTKFILQKANLLDEYQIMAISSYRLIRGIVNSHHPKNIYDLLDMPTRNCKSIAIIPNLRGKHIMCSYFNIGVRLFNQVPPNLSLQHSRKLKHEVREYMCYGQRARDMLLRCRS